MNIIQNEAGLPAANDRNENRSYMIIIHDSRNRRYRTPFGAAAAGTEITLSVDVIGADVVEAFLQHKRDEDPLYDSAVMAEAKVRRDSDVPIRNNAEAQVRRDAEVQVRRDAGAQSDQNHGADVHRMTASIKAPLDSCLIWYRFKLILKDDSGVHSVFYCNNEGGFGGRGRVIESAGELTPYQITVYKKSETPSWFKNGIVYQIFPDRFDRGEDWRERCGKANKRVNDRRVDMQRIIEEDWYRPAYYVRDSAKRVVKWPMYGGSLRGIMGRLDYLRSLGVTVIYLNPIFEASTNHRYDTGNYMKIDPALGTDQDFIDLAEEAGKRGIKLILDGVFSHTGSDSIYFDKYGNYPQDGRAAERIHGAWDHEDSPYRSWYKFDPKEKWGYKSWWGVEDLPEVIEEDPGFREYILGSAACREDADHTSETKSSSAAEPSKAAGCKEAAHTVKMKDATAGCEGVVPHWLRLGASGWRLDVADELPDSFIKGVRKAIKETDKEGLLIGEVWEDASNKISYGERREYFSGDELDGTMNYPLRSLLLDYVNYTISAGEAGTRFMSLAENYPRENLYGALNLIGSHDRERIITMMGAGQDMQSAVSKVKLLSTLEYALPGVPCIYYGDEAGLQGAADPENRSGFPWGRENSELQFHYRMLGLIYSEHPVLKYGDITMLSGGAGSNSESPAAGEATLNSAESGGISDNTADPGGTSGSTSESEGTSDNTADPGSASRSTSEDGNEDPEISPDVLAFIRSFTSDAHEAEVAAAASTAEGGVCGVKGRASINEVGVCSAERILVLANRSYGKTEVDLSRQELVRSGYAIDLFTSEELDPRQKITMDPLSVKMILMMDEPPEKVDLGRSAGVICHLGSLGEQPLGKKARGFVDYIKSAGLGVWQVLPVNPPGQGDSPYDCVSAFAGDPGLIDMDEVPGDEGYDAFCDENSWWLHGYAAYCVIKEKLGGAPLSEWPDEYRLADPKEAYRSCLAGGSDRIARIMHEQYWFRAEWQALKEYANSRGVRMMGDIPMYMSADSADVWAFRNIFRMDEKGRLAAHAGVPPDYFSKDGQDWGNPLYDWDALRRTGYDWWIKRIRQCAERFDILRIDHFRALSEYYAIPEGRKPSEGLWQPGPGADFINAVKALLDGEHLGLKLLAEDLGSLDAGVYDLLKLSGLPGMDIWQFSAYEMMAQPEQVARRRAFYTGTHDNSTLAGFVIEHAEEILGRSVGREEYETVEYEGSSETAAAGDGFGEDTSAVQGGGAAVRRIVLDGEEKAAVEAAAKDIIRKIMESPAPLAMLQLQDIFMLGDDARMNVPGVAAGNWKWRIPGDSIKTSYPDAEDRAVWLRELAEKTGRV